ncbi:MAG: glycosyl transferase family, partial [Glaciihabitans sp.]|nr:glycosyl transferase family [Glaciihabitans sp.]
DDGHEPRCGEMQWWGRVIGMHHHAASGPIREVVVVKGVNCAYRSDLLRQIGFDSRLEGTGAQVHWELSLGLAILRCGWLVRFDPALGVDHFPAERFDEDQRGLFNAQAQRNTVFNETLAVAGYLKGFRRHVFLVWAICLGTSGAPGVLQVVRLTMRREANIYRRWLATFRGRFSGFFASERIEVRPVATTLTASSRHRRNRRRTASSRRNGNRTRRFLRVALGALVFIFIVAVVWILLDELAKSEFRLIAQ